MFHNPLFPPCPHTHPKLDQTRQQTGSHVHRVPHAHVAVVARGGVVAAPGAGLVTMEMAVARDLLAVAPDTPVGETAVNFWPE